MDPNATLHAIEDALNDDDRQTALDYCQDLHTWRLNGGFAPKWQECLKATKFYVDNFVC